MPKSANATPAPAGGGLVKAVDHSLEWIPQLLSVRSFSCAQDEMRIIYRGHFAALRRATPGSQSSATPDARRNRQAKFESYNEVKSPLRLSLAIFASFLLASCGTNVTMLGPARPAISPAAVRIYQVPPRHYEQIAIINSSAGTTWIFPNRDSLDEAFADLRNEAAALGANGVLLQEVYDQPVGALSVGGGGFGYGHHGFYGGGGSVGGPLINRRVQAIAIYVRR